MKRKTYFSAVKRRWTAAPWCLVAAWAQAQSPTPAAEAPTTRATLAPDTGVGAPTAPGPNLKLPELRDLGVAVPRPVRAATAMLGMGRQRLALVVGISTVGARQVVDSAGRDAQAVAAALREGGFVVMLREDLGSADLRAALKEFHDRLQPGGVGFAYVAGLGAQVNGQNLLLPRDSNLDPALPLAERQAQWLKTGVPLSDVVDALMGPSDSPRMLVVDAAYQNPALAGLPAAGLAAQRLPPGMMALYGHALGKTQDVPAVGALSNPPPTDARELAASPFARALVGQLLAPRKRAPEVLRATHRSLYDGSLGQNDLWIAGDTDNEELAEASLLDVIPRTPEEIAREAASQAARALTRHTASAAASTAGATATTAGTTAATATAAGGAAAGEQSVSEVLDRVPKSQSGLNPDAPSNGNMKPSSARNAVADTPSAPSAPSSPSAPSLPDVPRPPTSLLSQAASVGSAISTAAGVAGTVASVAGTVATAAVMAKATEAAATVSVATTALGVAGSAAGQVMALAVRSVSGSAGEPQAAAVQQIAAARAAQAASAKAASATVAAAATQAAVPAAAQAATAVTGATTATAAGAATAAAPAAAAPLLAQTAQATQAAQAVSAVQGLPLAAAAPGTPVARLAQAAQAGQAAEVGGVPLGSAAAPAAGLPAAAARAPVGTPPRASAATGDLPVEQFSPTALAAAAPTSAAVAKAAANVAPNAAPGNASGLANEGANSALDATQPLAQANAAGTGMGTAPPANAAGPGAAKAGKPGLETPDNRTVRNAEGGERPSYAPRTNSYGYAEGDTYTYQVMDTWKGEVINRYTTAIEEVLPDGQMLANGQQMMMDAQGRLKKLANADGSVSQFEPSQDLWWSNPKRGESRDLRFTETIQRAGSKPSEVEWKGSTSVGKAQKIDTPAGEFEALPIESSGWSYEVVSDGMRSTKWSRTVWYSPKLGHPVAIDIQDVDRLGKLLKRERVELLHAQASRAATP